MNNFKFKLIFSYKKKSQDFSKFCQINAIQATEIFEFASSLSSYPNGMLEHFVVSINWINFWGKGYGTQQKEGIAPQKKSSFFHKKNLIEGLTPKNNTF